MDCELTYPWHHLSIPEQIGQLIVVRASGYLFDRQIRYPAWEPPAAKLRHWLETLNLGGVILLGGSAAELFLRSHQLQTWSPTPLFIAADIEEGVGQRFAGATWFAPPMALSAIAEKNLSLAQHYASQMGAITAREAQAIGINWLFAPVVDVNNNPDNPVINVRSFGRDPEIVSQLASAFIEGAKSYPVLTTAKHFPGHGDTATDSHLDLPVILHSDSRLRSIELPPFQQAIAAGVDSVMTAHLKIPAWDSQHPATLSSTILTGKLRQELGFEGLIVTDALIMGGVAQYASPGEIAVMAMEAGSDLLLMPEDPEVAIEAVWDAVESGRLSLERIQQSLERIWQAKQKIFNSTSWVNRTNELQVNAQPQTIADDLFADLYQLAQPDAVQVAEDILRHSSQLGGTLPLKPQSQGQGRNLIVVDDLLNCDFLDRQTPAVVIPKELGYQLQLLDQNSLTLGQEDSRSTLLQVFIRGNPFRGSAGLTPQGEAFYRQLLKLRSLQGLAIYGSPYVLEWFRPQLPVGLPWVFSYGQMASAQGIVCETLFDLSKSADKATDTFL